ncbi:MAG TPA: hypothetical protein PKM34_05880, partial [Bacteroidales bacterium]|nr:hypothetical protein [Bacteroidales bacterium]
MFREPPFRDFSPFLKILALIAIMIVTFLMVLALGVAISIPFFGKGILSEIAAVTDYQDERIMAALKYFQIVNQIGLFILPAILFVILTDDRVGHYLNLGMSIKRFSTLFGCIVLVISLPFINWMVMINNNIALPEFLSGVEEWMRRSEENARLLTEAFLSADTWK